MNAGRKVPLAVGIAAGALYGLLAFRIFDSAYLVLGDAEAVVLDADDDLAALTRARRPRTATIDRVR